MHDEGLPDKLISLFGVDVLLAVAPTSESKPFIDRYPHLYLHMWSDGIFNDKRCEFVDIRHAIKRAIREAGVGVGSILGSIVRPVWSESDPLAALFDVLLGRYPDVGEISIDYPVGIRAVLDMPDRAIPESEGLSQDLARSVTPLTLTGFGLSQKRDRSGWLRPGVVLGERKRF
jgi:hypothetical protein